MSNADTHRGGEAGPAEDELRRLRRLERVHGVVAAVNRELVRVREEQEVFDRACRIVVEQGRFRFAWIGLVDREAGRVVPVASAGFDDGYLDLLRVELAAGPLGEGPTGLVARRGEIRVCSDLEVDPAMAPWRADALARGYRSSAAFPLRREGRVAGALSIYAGERDGFDEQIVAALAGLADDLSFVLDAIERRRRRRAAEEALRAMETRLGFADRMASLGRLASGVAHEVNNPLAYVLLDIDFVADSVGELAAGRSPELLGQIKAALAEMREGAERVRDIVGSLRAFDQGEGHPVAPLDLVAVLDDAVNIASGKIRPRARLVKEHLADRPVLADAFRLGQVVVNLLLNAAEAIPEGRPEGHEIRLRTALAPGGRHVVLEVSDTGAGIPPEILPRIFDPFFTTHPVGVGAGLGLSVCHGIVTALGGHIEVETEVGRGTTFRVTLPAGEPLPPRPAPPPAASKVRTRMLLVDDDRALGRALARALAHHEVTVAQGGEAALALCRARPFDCIVCDVMMPDLGGGDVFEALQREGQGLERRMVFMTGGATSPSAVAFLARVSNRCVQKPFDLAVLEAAIEEVLAAEGEAARSA